MSFYTDATIADLPVILDLVAYSADPAAMGQRIASQTGDADLQQVLQDLGTDASGLTVVKGWAAFAEDFRTLLDAVQGIEDGMSFEFQVQTDKTGGIVKVTIGGNAIEV